MHKQFESAIELAKQGLGRTKISEQLKITEHVARAAITYVKAFEASELGLDDLNLDATFADFDDGVNDAIKPITIDGDNILTLSDIHFPRHHKEALLQALRYGIKRDVNAIYLNGDNMDCDKISRYASAKHVPDMSHEISVTREFLVKLRAIFPKAAIYFKEGNHEKRFVDYMVNNAPEMADLVPSFSELLGLANLGITHVVENQIAKVGSLYIVHGHEYKTMFGGGIYHARSTRLKAGTNVLIGHFHRTQTDIDRKLNDEYIGAWATGCLCKLDPKYVGKSKWNHGFARVEVYQDSFHVHNEIIL